MKRIYLIVTLLIGFIVTSCSSEQSLQQYYIANAENPNFMSFDLPSSLLNLEKSDLSESEKVAVSSLKKLNILAFQKKESNNADYEIQKAAIKSILKGADFSELMKMNTSFGKATIKIKGDDDTIDEIVIYGDNDEKGLILVRVLGDDMNPASFVQLIQAMEKSDFNGKGLEQLENFIKG
ncbi:DUF4252 domain-containing protein [Maribacter hydrothermalis]|uniref:DUF4252 domain-containing protein n=1 Tax=Maribacter hydrothermalis TaxID=1836467 RepID=A0A1B7Z7S8_9FLAO|nr:DUF4252 domain-containing protein [Maribacter hydrothermalis]APQ15868.1 hypothetical protein BTR34_00270 [Maribacter hydrothermalis]OBR38753.1 hypothetical protein A9200_03540 [Maribacter hydrothermalis]